MTVNQSKDQVRNVLASLIFWIIVLAACNTPKGVALEETKLEYIDLFSVNPIDETSCYRIPALMTAKDGSLIAAIDQRNSNCGDLRSNNDINIVYRRSTDNGLSWSIMRTIVDYPLGRSASDPSMILDDSTGEIFLFFNYMDLNKAPNQYFLQYVLSKDNGVSWSSPIDITDQISEPNWYDEFKFITSGRGIQTRSGALLHTVVNLESGLHVFGSDDHGASWFLIDTPITPGDESKIIELEDDTWMINSRVNKSGLRYVHTSDDNGRTWVSEADSSLIDPSCNASLIRYTSIKDGDDKNRLLFSNANSVVARENLTIQISYDEGNTWKYSKTVYKGGSAYSSLCILDNGDIGVFFEKDDYSENAFVSVTLDWLTDGEDGL